MTERRPIPGFPGYFATDRGQIIGPQGLPLAHLKEYPKVRINVPGRRNSRPRYAVHVLVALAWHGERPAGHDIDHIDRDVLNPAPENLSYKPLEVNRGVGATTNANAAKTACLRGHPYDEANTGRDTQGYRYCRACRVVRRLERERRSTALPVLKDAPRSDGEG